MAFFNDEYSMSSNFKSKLINDPVHGLIELPSFVIQFIDTPQFQRLRDLKQLGACHFVFPGGTHTRFEHCVGVCHLANQLILKLKSTQPELQIEKREIEAVQLAALCHDLGHGPFSHVFELFVRSSGPQFINWKHEEMSNLMLEYLIDENAIDIDRDNIKFIQSLIAGVPPSGFEKEKLFLYDIVANTRNSIDVDKFDYLTRDCYNLGIKWSYDFDRLLRYNRVINGELCYHSKEAYNIYEMFHTRYSLHKQIYTHKVSRAIEYMLSDVFTEANSCLHITDALSDPTKYINLSDSILKKIEISKKSGLTKAKGIIRNLRCRNLYKFADELLISQSVPSELLEKLTPQELIQHQPSGSSLNESDVIIDNLQLNYAMQNQNPVDGVKFYNKFEPSVSFTLDKKNVSLLIPNEFSERYVRIYCRNPTQAADAQAAFRNFINRMNVKPSKAFSLPQSPARSPAPNSTTTSNPITPKRLFD
eukprot:TRINITY_DN6918_c1_g1_i1.p1 TRINITY_DN6918_c1_g1~~TRINITY_DN6918_c1_g1_i1.p1  ORF type:complete len:476 (-),score=153.34 TRINITY_DN6918_c1_g1_i1:93-1520(-)